MKIQVNIERLILEGIDLPSAQGPLLQAAVEAELRRLLSTRGLSPALTSGGSLPSLRAQTLNYSGNNPTQLGQHIARSMYGSLGTAEEKHP
jgi:hypothetical protein